MAALLLVGGTLLGLGIWGWNVYASRPQVQNQLDGIALGATQIEVQLKKGKPARELAKEEGDKNVRWIFFDGPQREDQFTLVLFSI